MFNLFKRKNDYSKDKFKLVVSYTTRPMRDYEIDGKEHIFISDKAANNILKTNIPAAYTEIGEYKYFVLENRIKDLSNNLYIIDPQGIYSLLKEYQFERKYIVLYINTPSEIRDERAKSRPGYNEDIYKSRVKAEDEQFENFESNLYINLLHIPSYNINNSYNLEKTMKKIYKIIKKTYTENAMYLVVGRSCSGKDTICNELIRRANNEQ